ncbi:hypothetical protein B5M09_010615 [Aphanomyces astaci]|uniref:GOLD domain-containing protein n=1 Tax=Aphanomyces astaci TaxID=112090 RepID=A0A425CQX6_APHAT|nr:hypothetical protein B5M09_010615 [Aphanomyces astaci]
MEGDRSTADANEFPTPRNEPTVKRWPATIYDYMAKRVVDGRIAALDVEHGQWHRPVVSHIDQQLIVPVSVDVALSPSFAPPSKKRKKLTQLDVDFELQSSQLPTQHHVVATCPGALPAENFEILQIFARFGQIPSGAQVVRGADALGFQLFSTSCTRRLVSRRKNQPDCCDPCFGLFVDANLKKRIFQNMKTYGRVLAAIDSPELPHGSLVDLQNFLKIPVRNMNHAGKKLRLLVEQFIEHHKPPLRPQDDSDGATDRHTQAKAQEAELSLRVAKVKAQHELLKLGISIARLPQTFASMALKAAVVVALVAYAVQAAHFVVTPNDHKCFYLDVPEGTTFRAEYESPDTTDELVCTYVQAIPEPSCVPGHWLNSCRCVCSFQKTVLKIYGPSTSGDVHENVPASISQTLNQKGTVAFTSTSSGEHWSCVSIDTHKYVVPDATKMKFKLKLRFGTSHAEYENLAKKEQMNELELEVMKLRDRVKAIQNQQDYAQILVLLVAGVWQVRHLQSYFQKKKLV